MKKILFLLAIVATSFTVAKAQFGKAYVYPTVYGDTLTNVDTAARVIPMTAGYSVMGFTVYVTKLTGSAITGKAFLFQSLDGSNYTLTDSATYVTNPSIVANLTTPIAPSYTATAKFDKVTSPGVYYLLAAQSTGTVTQKVQFAYTARPYFTKTP